MKKIIYIFFAFSMLITVNSCKKTGADANVFSSVNNFGTGAYLTLDSTINVNFNSTALASSTVGIEVSEAPAGEAVQSIVLFVSTSAAYDTTQWSKIKTIPYAGPKTKITATGQEMATALNKPLSYFTPGTNYSFFTRVITKSGKIYDASNTGNDAGTGLVTGSTYHPAFVFTAFITCPYTKSMAGYYTVKRDDWNDWGEGDIVTVTDGPSANQLDFSQVYPGAGAGGVSNGKFYVNIDPATGTTFIPKEDIGNYGGPPDFTVQGTGSTVDANLGTSAGYAFSCTGYIGITVEFVSTTGTDYGAYTLILQYYGPLTSTGIKANSVKAARRKFN